MEELLKKYYVQVKRKAIGIPKYYEYNTDIYQAYEKPSHAKVMAFDYCRKMESEFGGWAGVIASKNTFEFTYDFLFEMNGRRYLMHISKCYNRAYPIKESA